MNHRSRAASFVALLLLLMTTLAACGSEDSSSETSTIPAGTPASGTTTAGSDSGSPQASADLSQITVGYIPALIYGPVMLAEEKGYFEEQGLDVQLEPLTSGSDMVVLTANGDFDIGIGGAGPAYFNATDQGIDLKIIAPLHFERDPQATPLMVSKKRFDSGELTDVADLEGKKVSVNGRGATEYWLDTALGTGGLSIEDIDLQTLPFPDVPAALDSGALDGAMLGEPFATLAEQQGLAVRLDTDFPEEFQPTFVWINPQFAVDSPELANGYMAGMMRGCRDQLSENWNSEENLAILNQYTNVDADLIQEAARTYCEPNGEIHEEDLATLQEFFADRELLEYDELVNVETLIDRSFVDAALEEIGTVEIE